MKKTKKKTAALNLSCSPPILGCVWGGVEGVYGSGEGGGGGKGFVKHIYYYV